MSLLTGGRPLFFVHMAYSAIEIESESQPRGMTFAFAA